jgi:dephospho-CoA kinase
MLKIGLTGGIGSGKSTVAEIFRTLGVPVFNSDQVARDLQENDPDVIAAMKKSFGEKVFTGGKLDRSKMASEVFKDKEKLQLLNSIIHPAVGKAFEKFLSENAAKPYAIKEAAILFELVLEKQLDEMITITAPEEIRIERVMRRDGVSEADVRARMKNQLPDETKAALSSFVLVNEGTGLVLPQVIAAHEKILEKAAR